MSQVVAELARLAVELAAIVLAPLLVGAVAAWLRKVGYELSAERRARLEARVVAAILATEEWAAAEAKRGVPVASTAKLERALARLPGVDPTEAADLIHAWLPRLGLGAAAALRQLRQAVQS